MLILFYWKRTKPNITFFCREMALASIQSFVDFMSTYEGGNDFVGEEYEDEACIVVPMLNLNLQCANQTVEFVPPLEQTKEIIVNCLQVIRQNNHE